MNTHLLIHFLFSHSLLSTIHSGFCSTYYNCPHPILNNFLKYQNQVSCVLKIKQNTNKSNHILPCSKCPSLFRKMAKILSTRICLPQSLLYLFFCSPDTSTISHLLGLDMLLSMLLAETPSTYIHLCLNNFYLSFNPPMICISYGTPFSSLYLSQI